MEEKAEQLKDNITGIYNNLCNESMSDLEFEKQMNKAILQSFREVAEVQKAADLNEILDEPHDELCQRQVDAIKQNIRIAPLVTDKP